MTQFEDQLRKYANVLVHYSMAGQFDDGLRGKTVHLSGERNKQKQQLVDLVVREVEQVGGTILDRMHDPNERVALLVEAITQKNHELVIAAAQAEGAFLNLPNTVYFNLRGSENPQQYNSFKGISISSIHGLYWQTLGSYAQKMMRTKPWTVALYPTVAEARSNGFVDAIERVNIHGYRKAVLEPCIGIDYKEIQKTYAELKALLDDAISVRITTSGLAGTIGGNLTIGLEGRIAVFDDGHKNLPGGEMFLTPIAHAVEGNVYTSVPFMHQGSIVRGIALSFRDGKIVSYQSVSGNQNDLNRLVKVYDHDGNQTGETYNIGEFSLGLHPGISPLMKIPLHTEKRGGVVVIALGYGYEQSVPELMNEPDVTKRDALCDELKAKRMFSCGPNHVDIPVFDASSSQRGCHLYVQGKGYNKKVLWNKDQKTWEIR